MIGRLRVCMLCVSCCFSSFTQATILGSNVVWTKEAIFNGTGKFLKFFSNATFIADVDTFMLEHWDGDRTDRTFQKTYSCTSTVNGTCYNVTCPLPSDGGRFDVLRLKIKSSNSTKLTKVDEVSYPREFECDWKEIVNPVLKPITVNKDTIIKWNFAKDIHVTSNIYYSYDSSTELIYLAECTRKGKEGLQQKCSLSQRNNFYNKCYQNFTVCLKINKGYTIDKPFHCKGHHKVCLFVQNEPLERPYVKKCEIKNGHARMEWTRVDLTPIRFKYRLFDENMLPLIEEKETDLMYDVSRVQQRSRVSLKVKACLKNYPCKCSEYTERFCDIKKTDMSAEEVIIYVLIPVAVLFLLVSLYACYRSQLCHSNNSLSNEELVKPCDSHDIVDDKDLVYKDNLIYPTPHYEEISIYGDWSCGDTHGVHVEIGDVEVGF